MPFPVFRLRFDQVKTDPVASKFSVLGFFQLVFFVFLSNAVNAQLGFPFCEKFSNNQTQGATVFGGNARLVDGVLRLTDAVVDQNGFMYVDIPFPSTYGIKATFEYFSYGGNGADGVTAFLFDANTPIFNPGGFGGSLGYAPRNNERGLSRAYLGIGFDEYGNFGNTAEGRNGGFFGVGTSLVPNSIVVRGPGDGFVGYPFVVGRRTMETGNDGMRPDNQFPISSGGPGTFRVTDRNQPGYRKVFLELEPNKDGGGYFLTVQMEVTTILNQPMMITIFDRPYFFVAPENLKIGFAASTGGLHNIHEIANITVEVFNEDDLLNPIARDIDDKASCAGQDNTYEITDQEVTLPNLNSQIRCLQFYGSLDDILAEEGDICSQARCRPENRVLVLPQGTFRAADSGGEFVFFPNPGFVDETVKVYYTVTDNYGKTSSGNYIKLLIKESPEPVTIRAVGLDVDAAELRRCAGEEVILRAEGDEEYFRFEWYRDNVLIPNSNRGEINVSLPGEYKVIAFNSKSCPTESTVFRLINPAFPDLVLINPAVGCEPNVGIDIRTFILNREPERFDYQLELPNGSLLVNDEMASVSQSGDYRVSVKHKDLSCWSEPVPLQVVIVSQQLVASFDYEVDATGIKGDEDGGIFIDDPVRFNDLSTGGSVAWVWDFGDGNSSTVQSPVHVFGKKGLFKVKLTVTNDWGCTSTSELVLPLTKSFRVMYPTGFTPTLSENRYFRPKTKGIVKMEMQVFNLWGNLIFQTNDLQTLGWDGLLNGELLPGGTYVYRTRLESIDGDIIQESGSFILIR